MHQVIFCSSRESRRSISSEKFREKTKYLISKKKTRVNFSRTSYVVQKYHDSLQACYKVGTGHFFCGAQKRAALLRPLNSGSDIVLKGNIEFAITPFL